MDWIHLVPTSKGEIILLGMVIAGIYMAYRKLAGRYRPARGL